MPKRSLLFLSVSIFLFIFHCCVTADDIDSSNQYESLEEFDKAFNCVQTGMDIDKINLVEVEACAKTALEIAESLPDLDSKKIAVLYFNYGSLLSGKGDSEREKSLEFLTRAYHLSEAAFGSTSCEMAKALFELASQKSYEKSLLKSAFYDYKKSLSTCVGKNVDYAWKIMYFLSSFNFEELNKKQLVSTKSFAKQAYDILRLDEGPNHKRTQVAGRYLGELYFLTEEYQKSIKMLEQSFLTNAIQMGGHPNKLDRLFSYLANAHDKIGNRKDSDKYRALVTIASFTDDTQLDTRSARLNLRPISPKQPVYPKVAQKLGKQGYAVIEVTVLPSGEIRDPKLLEERPLKLHFGKAAMRAAKSLEYNENQNRLEKKVLYKFVFLAPEIKLGKV